MYDVIIVDDEPIIRLGVKASIPWDEGTFRLAGEYANGAEAFKSIEAKPADILITDIKMPVMDGLTLMRRALERHPRMKVVLISSYNDFEYVREGLRLGAVDYILKHTMEPEELHEVLDRCAAALHSAQRTESVRERRRLENELKKRLCPAAAADTGWLPEAYRSGFHIAALQLDNVEELEQKYGLLYSGILLDDMQERFYEMHEEGVAVLTDGSGLALLLPKRSGNLQDMERLRKELVRHAGAEMTLGVFPDGMETDVYAGYLKSREACERRFFEGTGAAYVWQAMPEDSAAIPTIRLTEQLQHALASADMPRFELLLEQRMQQWDSRRRTPQEVKADAVELLAGLFIRQFDTSVLPELYRQIQRTETLDRLKSLLRDHFRDQGRQNRSHPVRSDANQSVLDKALEYIHRNYTKDLTLQAVADHVHISKNYFCILFKKYMNQNFIDYVIHLRICKAKELLRTGHLKIYEVAECSGFNDVKYFSKLFKKMTGYSPADFREVKPEA
jgi:two-component system response regulator YesN